MKLGMDTAYKCSSKLHRVLLVCQNLQAWWRYKILRLRLKNFKKRMVCMYGTELSK